MSSAAEPPAPPLRRVAADSLDPRSELQDVIDAAEREDGTPPVSDQALLAAKQGKRALFGVTGPGPGFDGVGIMGEGEIDLVIRPGARGRGLGTAALDAMIAARGLDTPPSHAAANELRAWAHGENPAAKALLAHAGFAPIRSLYRLALPAASLPASIEGARAMPEGFRLAVFDPGDAAQAEAWVRVNSAAFASHPEQGAVTLEDFRALIAEPWFDPDDLLLALDAHDGSLAGYSWIKTTRGRESGEEVETELYVLGVDPAYAGRGLGAGLLGETLKRMSQHSPDRITLYVDGDNENARALYDRAGFVTDQRSTQWLLH